MNDARLNSISIVLHRPVYPRNVGMCARAAANMGLSELVVVDPRFDWRLDSNQFEARQGAAHASPMIRSALVYPTIEAFCSERGSGVRIGFSGIESPARRTDQFEHLLETLISDRTHPLWQIGTSIQLHFGTEDSGLSREEFEIMNFVCMLPTSSAVPSLNLSHAVLLAVYILKRALSDFHNTTARPEARSEAQTTASNHEALIQPIPKDRLEHPRRAIRDWLLALGFDLDSRRNSIEVSLNRVLLSHCPHPEDVRLVEKVLFQTVAKLKAKHPSREDLPKS